VAKAYRGLGVAPEGGASGLGQRGRPWEAARRGTRARFAAKALARPGPWAEGQGLGFAESTRREGREGRGEGLYLLGGDTEEGGGGGGEPCVSSAVVDGRVDRIVDLLENRGVAGRIKRRGGGTERRKSDGTTINQGETQGKRVAIGGGRSQWCDGARDRRAAAYGGCGRGSTIEVCTKNQN